MPRGLHARLCHAISVLVVVVVVVVGDKAYASAGFNDF